MYKLLHKMQTGFKNYLIFKRSLSCRITASTTQGPSSLCPAACVLWSSLPPGPSPEHSSVSPASTLLPAWVILWRQRERAWVTASPGRTPGWVQEAYQTPHCKPPSLVFGKYVVRSSSRRRKHPSPHAKCNLCMFNAHLRSHLRAVTLTSVHTFSPTWPAGAPGLARVSFWQPAARRTSCRRGYGHAFGLIFLPCPVVELGASPRCPGPFLGTAWESPEPGTGRACPCWGTAPRGDCRAQVHLHFYFRVEYAVTRPLCHTFGSKIQGSLHFSLLPLSQAISERPRQSIT